MGAIAHTCPHPQIYTHIHIKINNFTFAHLDFLFTCLAFPLPYSFFFFKIIFHCLTVSYFHIMCVDHINPSLPSSSLPGVSPPHLLILTHECTSTHTWTQMLHNPKWNIKGQELERWLRCYEDWLFFQRTWTQFPEPMWQPTTIHTSVPGFQRLVLASVIHEQHTQIWMQAKYLYTKK